MNKLFSIFAILSVIMVFSSCKDHDEDDNSQADKTIFIYMPYTGSSANLYSFFQENIDSIKSALKVNGLGNNRVVAFVSQTSYKAHLIEFKKNNKKGDAIVNDTLMTFDYPELTTEEGLTEIISKVKEYAPAEKYAMIIGSHGMGWLPAQSSSAAKKSRYFGSGTAEYQTDLSTLASALTNCGIKLQFALFDCCYMACIENVYEMRNVTDYYIASTSEIMDVGMPYSKIFHSLMLSEPNYSDVVDRFNAFYTTYSMPYGTISATKCQYAEEMANLMKQINQSEGFDNTDMSEVQDLDVGYYTPTVFFDFGSYVDHCCKDENLLSQYHTLMDKLVPYKKSTNSIYSGSGFNHHAQVKEFSGLTISDGSTNSEVIETKQNTPWWKATH